MSATLNKITTKAKQIRKAHPSMKWTAAIKQASATLKREGKIGGAKATRKPTRPAKRKKVVRAKARPRRKIGSRMAVRVAGVTKRKRKGPGKSSLQILKDRLGSLYVKYYMTQSISETKKLSKQITEVKKKIRSYQKSK